MGPVFTYLVAWIVGGVSLSVSMLLLPSPRHMANRPEGPQAGWGGAIAHALPLSLLALGMAGLCVRGFGWGFELWTVSAAALLGAVTGVVGYLGVCQREKRLRDSAVPTTATPQRPVPELAGKPGSSSHGG